MMEWAKYVINWWNLWWRDNDFQVGTPFTVATPFSMQHTVNVFLLVNRVPLKIRNVTGKEINNYFRVANAWYSSLLTHIIILDITLCNLINIKTCIIVDIMSNCTNYVIPNTRCIKCKTPLYCLPTLYSSYKIIVINI